MKVNIGEVLAVRINSYKNKTDENYGSGVIYKTRDANYDLIFTAKHCLCRRDSSLCKMKCDLCNKQDYALSKVLIDNPSNSNFPKKIKALALYCIDNRDFAVIKVPKLSISNLVTPAFTDNNKFNTLEGWGYPVINNSSEVTQYHFRDASLISGENSKMWLPIQTSTIPNLNDGQGNIAGFSGAGIICDNKYLIGIYTDTQSSANGKGVIIDKRVNDFLAEKKLETLEIENNFQLMKTRVNEEFIECFDKIDTLNISDAKINILCIKFDGRKFNVESVKDRLDDNIRYFALSDSDIETFEQKKLTKKGDKLAEAKFKGSYSVDKVADLFAFSFLEADLKAPKLFSDIEINNPFTSIHIVVRDDSTYSLVHSKGSMLSGLDEAINKCLEYIGKNKTNCISPNALISNSVASLSYNEATYSQLKQIMMPSNDEKEYDMYNSFGIFIGYDLNVEEFIDLKMDYKNSIRSKIKEIVDSMVGSISKKLGSEGLMKTQINLYIVPFEDVDTFSSDFLDTML